MSKDEIKLLDLIDRRTLQTLQDAFANATGMAALATDDTGAVTELSNPTDFCMKYTRNSREGCERCNKCDLQGGAEANRTGRPATYFCHANLVDFAVPIIINGQHIGSLIGGQVLTEEPDEEKFRKIAREIGVNPDEYIAALRKVKIVPKKQVDAAANLLSQIASALSEAGYQRLLAVSKESENDALVASVNEKFNAIEESMDTVTKSIRSLDEHFTGIKDSAASSAKAVDSTDSIVKAIENASTQLTLIGFNASIEAKRAGGTAGAGFNVIAQEVRSLADKNTKQASEVETTLTDIKKAIIGINSQLKNINTEIDKNVEIIDSLKALLDETSVIIHSIK